jgi:ferrochelatase
MARAVSDPAVDSVLLLAFGGPTRPEEIRPFLDNVLRGRPIPPARVEEVVQHYLDVGGSSPLNALTARQAEGLRAALRRDGPDLPVYVGMRHWHPMVREALAEMQRHGHRRAVGIVLAAHPSDASREAYARCVAEARQAIGDGAPAIEFVGPWFDHPLFIDALVGRVNDTMAPIPEERRARAAILFTAHSIPVAMSERSGYERSLRRTADLVARATGLAGWRLVYQSRSGNPAERWLEPDISDAIRELATSGDAAGTTTGGAAGAVEVVVAPIGFVSDHVEVLYDLDVAARAAAAAAGVGFHRAPTPGDHPAFLRLLATLVRDHASGVATPGVPNPGVPNP